MRSYFLVRWIEDAPEGPRWYVTRTEEGGVWSHTDFIAKCKRWTMQPGLSAHTVDTIGTVKVCGPDGTGAGMIFDAAEPDLITFTASGSIPAAGVRVDPFVYRSADEAA